MIDDECHRSELNEVVLSKEDNIIYIDFILLSMVKSVEKWYKEYYHGDVISIKMNMKTHLFYIIRQYDRRRFSDPKTIGEERTKYLEEIDLYVQMRREE